MEIKDFSLEIINDPIVSTYKGILIPIWASYPFHHFEIVRDPAKRFEIGNLFFEAVSLEYRYKTTKFTPEIGYAVKGFDETNFSHADYAAYETCSPSPYFLAESAPAPEDMLKELESKLMRYFISDF